MCLELLDGLHFSERYARDLRGTHQPGHVDGHNFVLERGAFLVKVVADFEPNGCHAKGGIHVIARVAAHRVLEVGLRSHPQHVSVKAQSWLNWSR